MFYFPCFLTKKTAYYTFSFCTFHVFSYYFLEIIPYQFREISLILCWGLFYTATQYCGHIPYIEFNQPPMFGDLGGFQYFTTTNNAIKQTLCIHMQRCSYFVGCIFRVNFCGQERNAHVVLLNIAKFSSMEMLPFWLPISNEWKCLFSPSLINRVHGQAF